MIHDEFPIDVEIQSLEEVRVPGGGYDQEWTTLKEIACQKAPITDDKRLEAMQEVNNVIYEWFVPYDTVQELRTDLALQDNEYLASHIRVKHGTDLLELRGRGKNLGGMNEIVEFTLRLITP